MVPPSPPIPMTQESGGTTTNSVCSHHLLHRSTQRLTHRPTHRPTLRWVRLVLAGLLAYAVLIGCTGSSEDSSAGRDLSGAGGGSDAEEAASLQSPARQAGSDVAPREANALLEQKLIKTGAVRLHAAEVGKAIQQINDLVATEGGSVTSETTTTDDGGQPRSSRLELRVPVETFEKTVDAIEEVGTLVATNSREQDVTTQVADIDARVRSARIALDSLRRLFARATKLGQVISLETQLAQRQADLESLLSQQRVLAEQTAMSTITVDVSRPPSAPDSRDDHQAGFVAGVQRGWDAFVTFTRGTAHFLGVVLPLGLLAALVAGVGWVGVRRRLPRSGAASSK